MENLGKILVKAFSFPNLPNFFPSRVLRYTNVCSSGHTGSYTLTESDIVRALQVTCMYMNCFQMLHTVSEILKLKIKKIYISNGRYQ